MIKADELRIGNIVKSTLTKEFFVVDWLAIKHVYDGNIQSIYNPDISVYEPVELTPEILEAAGFEYNEFTENYEIFIDYEGLIALNKYDYSIFIGADNEDRGTLEEQTQLVNTSTNYRTFTLPSPPRASN